MEKEEEKKLEQKVEETKKEAKKVAKKASKKVAKNKEKKASTKKEKKQKANKKIAKKPLVITLYIAVIVLIATISFGGIYIKNKNKFSNVIPEYILGTDLYGSRDITIKVDDGTVTKKYDENGNEVTDDSKTENVTSKEVPINDESVLTIDNYKKTRDIVLSRLDYLKVNNYECKFNEADGTIKINVPENTNTDYISQYCVTKGYFTLTDSETKEVLLENKDIKEAKVQYNTTSSGTTVYLAIQFNKDATNKLKDISKTYIKSQDAEGKDVTKEIQMSLDDQKIISTYFDQEIDDGLIQLSIGTSATASEVQNYLQQASNIAVFLNTNPMPITYKIDINRFVYSDLTSKTLTIIVIVAAIVLVAMLAFMIIKYKKQGILGAINTIGFLALLLLALRYGNVDITLVGLLGIAISVVLEYLTLIHLLKISNSKLDNETKEKEMKNISKKELRNIIPILIIAVTFALCTWEPIVSIGMILFWAIIISILYNLITLNIIFMKESK